MTNLKVTNLKVTMVSLKQFRTSPTQPRKHHDPVKHKELTESMRQKGFTLSALLVRKVPGGNGGNGSPTFEVIAGERRWRAAEAAGIDEAPCFIRDLSDQDAFEIQLMENIQREDLTAIEEAEGYRQILELKDKSGKPLYTLESLAQRIGRAVLTIRRRLKLCELNAEAKREIDAGRFSPTVAVLLAFIPDLAMRDEATKEVLHPRHKTDPLSKRETEELIHRKFIRDLRPATFDQADDKLLPVELDEKGERAAGGACVDCPFKAANAPGAVQEQGRSLNICLNPPCFDRKQKLKWEQWQQAESDSQKKRRAVSEEQSNRLYPRGDHLARSFGLVDLDEHPDGNDLKPGETAPGPWRKLTRGAELEVIVSPDRYGAKHELVDRDQAIEAAVTVNKYKIFKTQERAQRKTDETRKTEEKAKEQDRDKNKAAQFACIELVKKAVTNNSLADLLRLLMDREIEHSNAKPEFFKRYHLPIGGSVLKQLRTRKAAELVAMLVEFVISEGGFMYEDEVPESDRAWLKIFGVDYAKVAKKITAKK